MPICIRRLILEDHLAALEHGALRDQGDGVLAGVFVAIIYHQLRQVVDIELILWDHAAVGRPGHGRQHGGEASIAPKDLQYHQALVRAGNGAQVVG